MYYFIRLFNKYVLSPFRVLGTAFGKGDIKMNDIMRVLRLRAYSLTIMECSRGLKPLIYNI